MVTFRKREMEKKSISPALMASRYLLYIYAAVLLSPIIYLINLSLLAAYTDGDLLHYRNFYEIAKYAPWRDMASYQAFTTGSGEPLYRAVVFISAKAGIEHDTLIALTNTALIVLVVVLCAKYQASLAFIVLVLSNYYLLVLLTGAERLKFAYFLIVVSALIDRKLISLAVASLAPLTHTQTIFHLLALKASDLSQLKLSRHVSIKGLLIGTAIIIGLLSVVGVMLQVFGDLISRKAGTYSAASDPTTSVLKLLALTAVGVVVLKSKFQIIYAMAPIIAVTAVIGSDRLQICAMSVLCFFVLREGRTAHPVILLLLGYFTYKSISFMQSVIAHGQGFGASAIY